MVVRGSNFGRNHRSGFSISQGMNVSVPKSEGRRRKEKEGEEACGRMVKVEEVRLNHSLLYKVHRSSTPTQNRPLVVGPFTIMLPFQRPLCQ